MSAISFAEFESGARQAEAQVANGQWRSAFRLYGDLLQRRLQDLRFDSDALTDTDLVVFERVADIAVPLGETAAADAIYAVACDLHRDHDPQRFSHAAVKRVQIALASDRFDEAMRLARLLEPTLGPLAAIECTERGLARWESTRPWNIDAAAALEAQIYLVLGRLLAGSGQFDNACALFARGITYTSSDRPMLAQQAMPPLRLALAAAALARGDVTTARTVLRHLDGTLSRPGDLVRLHEIDAGASMLRGEFARAQEALELAANICRQNEFTHGLAGVLLTRAKLFLVTNLTAEAESDIEEAHAIGSELQSAGVLHRAARLLDYGRVRQHALFGNMALADPVAFLQTGASSRTANPSTQGAPLKAVSWRPADFLAYYEERELELMTRAQGHAAQSQIDGLLGLLIEDFAHTDSEFVQARLQLIRGVCELQKDASATAWALCADAAGAFQAFGLPSDEYVARRFEALCYERSAAPAASVLAVRARMQSLLDLLTSEMSTALREAFLVNKWSQREAEIADAVTELLSERERYQTRSGPARWIRTIGWRARVSELHDAIRDVAETPSASTAVSWSSLIRGWRALLTHPRDAQTVSFAALANGLVRVTVRWCHCDLEWLPVPRGRLRSVVRRFHQQMATADSEKQVEATATELSESLRLPQMLASLPQRIRRLVIFPDDQLNGFPFAVLPATPGTVVVDRWATTIGVRRTAGRRVSGPLKRVTIAAANGGTAWPELREAGAQSVWLTRWWQNRGGMVKTLSTPSCDATAFLSALATSEVFHFSGHGQFDPDRPERTGIVVDGPGDRGAIVSLAQVAGVECTQLRFATFLSCWSADSFLFPGRWAVSIPSALCRAGAACVVAPLWEIEDALSTELLTSVYEGVARHRVDEAVRQAQLRARTLPNGERRSVFFWAGLQVYGDGAHLGFAKGFRWQR